MKTRVTCVLLVLGGVLVNTIFGYYAYHPRAYFAAAATYIFLGYFVAVPIILYFLKGERAWRWTVFALWSMFVTISAYLAFTVDLD